MNITFNKRLAAVWAILAGLTVSYLWIDRSADHHGTFHPSIVVTVIAILIALLKVRIIFREFMEVRHAPALLRRLTDLWVVLIGVGLIASYLAGTALR
jgi:Prokaryotic Cytochrome C oxidase subunit IV